MIPQSANTAVDGHLRGSTVDDATLGQTDDAELVRRLLDPSTVGVIAMDTDGTIGFANALAADILGYQPSEFVGESLPTVIVDERRPRIQPIEDLGTDTGQRINLDAQHNECHHVPISIDVRDLALDSARFILGYVRAETEADEPEIAINRYEAIAEMAGDGVYQLDSTNRFGMVSDTLVEMTGYPRDELLGEHASKLLDEDAISPFN